MVNIALITDPNTPASVRWYRSAGPLSFLERQTGGAYRVTRIPQDQFVQDETAAFGCDIAMIERPISPAAYTAMRICKDQGVITWLDYDDNLFSVPEYNSARDFYEGDQPAQIIKECMSAANVITTATAHLKEMYSGYNNNVRYIPNAWNDFRHAPLPAITDPSKPIRMAWRGSNKHEGDLYGVRVPLSRAIQDPAFQWIFMGFRYWHLGLKKNQYLPFSSLSAYFRNFFTAGADYLFVPLQVNDFNKGKSNCSWIEATIAGAVTIAPVGLPEFDQPGVIRYRDNKELGEIFNRIKSGGYDKRERVEASREELNDYRLSSVNMKRAEIVASFFGVPQEVSVVEEKTGEDGGI